MFWVFSENDRSKTIEKYIGTGKNKRKDQNSNIKKYFNENLNSAEEVAKGIYKQNKNIIERNNKIKTVKTP